MHKHQRVLFPIGILLLVLLLFQAGCAPVIPGDAVLEAAYRHAVRDAEVSETREICHDLEPVVPGNPQVTWQEQQGKSSVLLLTWTGWDGYNGQIGQTVDTTRDTWTVLPEELKGFCKNNTSFTGDRLVLRLEQLYGLPPHNGKKWFVEMWADPADIFRPSPDPEITDREAQLDFPANTDEAYKNWFNDLKERSYGEDGYPWTRLGYTYDWGNPADETGLSEFVIRTGAEITVHSVTGTFDYCKN